MMEINFDEISFEELKDLFDNKGIFFGGGGGDGGAGVCDVVADGRAIGVCNSCGDPACSPSGPTGIRGSLEEEEDLEED